MNAKITITNTERSMIVAALLAYDDDREIRELALSINERFINGDPANDGPEASILRESPDA